MNNFKGICCIVCNNSDEQLFKVKYQKENFDIVECQKCSFIFIPAYYRKEIDYRNYKSTEVVEEVAKADVWLKIQRNLLRYRLIQKYQKTGRLYDIGFGFGHFLLSGKQLGYDVTGVEKNRASVEFVRKQYGIEVEENDFLKIREDVTYDIMTLWDVLEHIDDADKIIEKVSRVLCPGGYVYIQVPQAGSLFATLFGRNWWALGLDHVNYFSKQTIKNILQKYGLSIIKIYSSIEMKNVLLYVILPKLKHRKRSKENWTASNRQREFNKLTTKPMWIRRFLVGVHNIVYTFLSYLHIGDEMIIVAQKR
jgi:2-polyprenyl-3-methyl-5-hydroxy-6-metoxy-1,4-benzoquinol methylase